MTTPCQQLRQIITSCPASYCPRQDLDLDNLGQLFQSCFKDLNQKLTKKIKGFKKGGFRDEEINPKENLYQNIATYAKIHQMDHVDSWTLIPQGLLQTFSGQSIDLDQYWTPIPVGSYLNAFDLFQVSLRL